MITAGQFNKKVIIRSITEGGTDDEGYPIEGSKVDKPLWAMVKPVSAREYHEAKANQTENVTRFIVRYSRIFTIDTSMKVIYKGKTFEIESVINDDEANITLTIIGREVATVGSK